MSDLRKGFAKLWSDWGRSVSGLPTLWPQVRINRVAAAVVAGGAAVVVLELLADPEFEYGLAVSLWALLLVLALLTMAVWDLILKWFSPSTLNAQTAFLPIPLVLRPWLFLIGLAAGVWFGSEHW